MTMTMAPPPGYIRLILIPVPEAPPGLCLQIPLVKIDTMCSRPAKYLRFLAYAVLGREGCICLEEIAVHDDEHLVDRAVYTFEPLESSIDLAKYIVDLQAFKKRTVRTSEESGASQDAAFKDALLERDIVDIFDANPTPVGDDIFAEGIHIIPFSKGDEWIQLLIQNRPQEANDDLTDLISINDTRNGFLAGGLNSAFDAQACSILVTPNKVLDMDDVPKRAERVLTQGVQYPQTKRYTLQGLTGLPLHVHNTDAAFSASAEDMPSSCLLLYHYGASVLRHWGIGLGYLDTVKYIRPLPPSPSPSIGQQPGRAHDRSIAIAKRQASNTGEQQDQAQESKPDTFDLVLALWANTPYAVRRREQEDLEFSSKMREWVVNVKQPGEYEEQEESTSNMQHPDQDVHQCRTYQGQEADFPSD